MTEHSPRPNLLRWNLGSIMIAVALSAVGFTCLGVVGGTQAMVVGVIISAPYWRRPVGKRLPAIVLLCSLYPILVLASLYLTWITAWVVIGREPKAVDEAPGRLGPIVAGPYVMTTLMLFGLIPSFFGAMFLSMVELKRQVIRNPALKPIRSPILLGPVAWFVGVAVVKWEPYLILLWFRS